LVTRFAQRASNYADKMFRFRNIFERRTGIFSGLRLRTSMRLPLAHALLNAAASRKAFAR